MIRVVLICLALACAMIRHAQAQVLTIPVRGGEHAQYTRLVLPLSDGVDWRLLQDGRRAVLTLAGTDIRFDVTQTFARIPRTRLRDLRASPEGLELTLGCECDLRAAEDLAGMLVIDIVGPEQAQTQGQAMRPLPRPARASAPPAPDAIARRAGTAVATALRNPPPAGALPTLAAAPVLGIPSQPQLPASGPEGAPAAIAPEAVLAQLGGAVAVAVGQNLLLPSAGQPETRPSDDTPPPGALSPLAAQQVAVTDSIARARGLPMVVAADPARAQCPPPTALAIDTWQRGTDSAAQALVPTALYDLRDQLDHAAATAAARGMVYWGFGTEARLILSMLPAMGPEEQLLADIATVVELGPARAPRLRDLAPCGPFGALFAAFATLPDRLAPDFPVDQALTGIAQLPAHLRLHLGPALLRHLELHGDDRHAQVLRDMLARVARPDTRGMNGAGGTDPSKVAAVDTRTPLAPEELLVLLDQYATSRAPLPDALRLQAESQAVALRRTAPGDRIAAHWARALARDGKIDAAFDVIAEPDLIADRSLRAQVRSDLFLALTDTAPDIEFLQQVFRQDPWSDPPRPDTARALSQRLRALGFADQAAGLLNDTDPFAPPLAPANMTAPDSPAAPTASSTAPTAPPGLLGAGRAALRDSAALRARMAELLPPD